MTVSRIAFAIRDLEREIRNLAPQVGVVELGLPAGTFGPVVGELASQSGEPAKDPGVYRLGNVAIVRSAS